MWRCSCYYWFPLPPCALWMACSHWSIRTLQRGRPDQDQLYTSLRAHSLLKTNRWDTRPQLSWKCNLVCLYFSYFIFCLYWWFSLISWIWVCYIVLFLFSFYCLYSLFFHYLIILCWLNQRHRVEDDFTGCFALRWQTRACRRSCPEHPLPSSGGQTLEGAARGGRVQYIGLAAGEEDAFDRSILPHPPVRCLMCNKYTHPTKYPIWE